jgi:hypothetical protein
MEIGAWSVTLFRRCKTIENRSPMNLSSSCVRREESVAALAVEINDRRTLEEEGKSGDR